MENVKLNYFRSFNDESEIKLLPDLESNSHFINFRIIQ